MASPLDLLSGASITGGAAAPSMGQSDTGSSWVQMNSPFSVAGSGGSKANSEGGTMGFNQNILIWAIIIGGAVLVLK